MTTNATVIIPQYLYERVQQIAKRQYRDVNEVASEMLEKGISPWENTAWITPEREREKEAFHHLHDMLLKKHKGEYIAIYNGQLIDHDTNRTALFKRIEENYPDQYVLIRPVNQTPEIVYDHRSIRWA